jgi:hypothetical protein
MTDNDVEANLPDCTPAWGSAAGYLQPRGPISTTLTLADLVDRYAVQDTVLRYSYAYDERALNVLRALLTDEAVFAYTISGSPLEEVRGKETLVSWLADIMESQTDQRRHAVTNVVVQDISSDRATVVGYISLVSVAAKASLVTTGFYRFDLEKSGGVWRIAYILDGLDRPF